MKVKTVMVCPHCEEVVDKLDSPLEKRWECGECEEVYEDQDEARECCKE